MNTGGNTNIAQDYFGKQINIGDHIVYKPARSSMFDGVVIDILPSHTNIPRLKVKKVAQSWYINRKPLEPRDKQIVIVNNTAHTVKVL